MSLTRVAPPVSMTSCCIRFSAAAAATAPTQVLECRPSSCYCCYPSARGQAIQLLLLLPECSGAGHPAATAATRVLGGRPSSCYCSYAECLGSHLVHTLALIASGGLIFSRTHMHFPFTLPLAPPLA